MDNLFPRYGMVLIVGTTGSGKSTLLAAAHRYRLEERRHDPVHILTYEQPVEYLLKGYAQASCQSRRRPKWAWERSCARWTWSARTRCAGRGR